MELTRLMCPSSNHSIKCPYSMVAENLTIHNTANKASAMSEVSYMIGNSKRVSFHYAVDDYRVVQGIETNRNSWNAGDGANGNGNRKSISIEICYSLNGGEQFTKAEQNGAMFTALLLKERGWDITKVKKHQDWSGKYCPHRTLDLGWGRFLNMVESYLYTFDIKNIDSKKVILIQDTPLYNFDNEVSTEVKGYPKDTILEVSAIATTSNGTSYYLTNYSYLKGINNGFNINYCKDYVEEPIIEVIEEPILEPIEEEIDEVSTNDTQNIETIENAPQEQEIEPIIEDNEVVEEEITKTKSLFEIIIDFIIKLFKKGGN